MAGKSTKRAGDRSPLGSASGKRVVSKTGTNAKAPAHGPARTAKPKTTHEKLAAELAAMIPEIDAEGLLFLVRQASVLLHNKRVDELNAEIEQQNGGKKAVERRAGTTARVGRSAEEITVEIQRSPDGKTYYMIINGQKHFLTAQEMAAVTQLCFKPERKSDALRLLFRYLTAERKEILDDHGVSAEKHPFFEALFHEVRSSFTLER